MSRWFNVLARLPEPVPVDGDDWGYATMSLPQMFRVRVQKIPGPVPDSTGIVVEQRIMGDTGVVAGHDQWSITNVQLRSTPVGVLLHTFGNIGPLTGRIEVSLTGAGGLVAHLHYPTLPGPYQLSLL